MKALAVDTSTTRISISAFNEQIHASLILQAEMKQSEKLVPAIEYIMNQANLKPEDLQFLATTSGPGSFTGLRLGISALKAFQLSLNCPLYAVPTLECYFSPFSSLEGTVIPVIDAKKERFYVSLYRNGTRSIDDSDLTPEQIVNVLDPEEKLFLVGDDAPLLREKIISIRPFQTINIFNGSLCTSDQLLFIAEKKYQNKEPSMADYDGPIYIRKSEAEEKNQK